MEIGWLRVVPDAFEISHRLAIVYEVEDTHRVDDAKLRAYGRLWHALDSAEWELKLVILDIRGGRLEPQLSTVFYHGPMEGLR